MQPDEHLAFSFRDTFSAPAADGTLRQIEIRAAHSRRRRVPRGHELVRQMSRGQPLAMIEVCEYQWQVLVDRRLLARVRQLPNGHFQAGPRTAPTLRALACALACVPVPATLAQPCYRPARD